jgi:vanillate O-demethylase monooxygenase subunit
METIIKTAKPAAAASASAQQVANHQTPLILNCWYVGALSHEVSREMFSRKLLGTKVLMYRTLDGTPVAMDDRCPHRSFPLSKGSLDGDNVVCGYHGICFNQKGECQGMPSLPKAPTHVSQKTFKCVEKGPLIWVWLGDQSLADEAKIPDTSWLESSEWATVNGSFHIATNYVAMHENLLDQTHFGILHPGLVGTPDYASSNLEVRTEENRVFILRTLMDSPAPGIYDSPMRLNGKRVDRYSDSRFESPAAHIAHAKIVDPTPESGQASEYLVNISHLFTPETQNSIHYWWFTSRNFYLHDAAASEFMKNNSDIAYQQDEEALRWIQETYDEADGILPEMSFGPDRPGLLARRILLAMAQQEQESH